MTIYPKRVHLRRAEACRSIERFAWSGCVAMFCLTFIATINWIWGGDYRWIWTFLLIAVILVFVGSAFDSKAKYHRRMGNTTN